MAKLRCLWRNRGFPTCPSASLRGVCCCKVPRTVAVCPWGNEDARLISWSRHRVREWRGAPWVGLTLFSIFQLYLFTTDKKPTRLPAPGLASSSSSSAASDELQREQTQVKPEEKKSHVRVLDLPAEEVTAGQVLETVAMGDLARGPREAQRCVVTLSPVGTCGFGEMLKVL